MEKPVYSTKDVSVTVDVVKTEEEIVYKNVEKVTQRARTNIKVVDVQVPVENEVIKVQKDIVRVDMTVMKPVEKPKELKIIKHV